jgi:hypothetical protein
LLLLRHGRYSLPSGDILPRQVPTVKG